MNEIIIVAVINYMLCLFRSSPGRCDALPFQRVFRNAMHIAESEPICDRDVVALATLLRARS